MKLVASNTFDFNTGGCYFNEAFEDADTITKLAETVFNYFDIEFDSMVAVGLSGVLVLPLLARHFNVPFLALRKTETDSHDKYGTGQFGRGQIGRKYLIVDDFICSGSTVEFINRRITTAVTQLNIPFTPEYVGSYGYARYNGRDPGIFTDPSGKKKSVTTINIDGEAIVVNAKTYSDARYQYRNNVHWNHVDPKGQTIKDMSNSRNDYDLDELASILIALENLYRS